MMSSGCSMIPPIANSHDKMTHRSTTFGRFLFRLTGWLRCRIIRGNHGEPYLERYHLFRLPGGGGAYIHRFLDSDPDRGLHDHPWRRALGIVLSGGYLEQRLVNDQVREQRLGPGRLNRLRGEDFHRVVLPNENEAWTFFVHTGRIKDWGFLTTDSAGGQVYTPHEDASQEGSHARWWRQAPRGRHTPRQPLAVRA